MLPTCIYYTVVFNIVLVCIPIYMVKIYSNTVCYVIAGLMHFTCGISWLCHKTPSGNWAKLLRCVDLVHSTLFAQQPSLNTFFRKCPRHRWHVSLYMQAIECLVVEYGQDAVLCGDIWSLRNGDPKTLFLGKTLGYRSCTGKPLRSGHPYLTLLHGPEEM